MYLAGESIEVWVLPHAGGRIHRLRAFGVDVLRTPEDEGTHEREPYFWGSYPLVPWVNRVPGGRLHWGDSIVELPAHFEGHAIHGEAATRPWEVVGDGALRFVGGAFGYPWPYEARQELTVIGNRLRLELSVTNIGDQPMPAGLGIHPWFTAPLEVELPVTKRYEGVVPAPGEPVPTEHRPLSHVPWGTDAVFTGLTASSLRMRWPGRLDARLSWSAAATHLCVAAFEDFDAVALEPQTHATDGFRRLRDGEPGAVSVVPPGGTLAVSYLLDFSV